MAGREMLSSLHDAVRHIRVTPIAPPTYCPHAPSEAKLAAPDRRDASSSWSATIRYVDVEGEETERSITCYRLSGFADMTHIVAHCHVRDRPRTFRIDRIRELVCEETGECLDPETHFEMLRVTGALAVEDKALIEIARIVTFLSRCDGEYHPLEHAAIADVLSRYAVRFGGTDRDIESTIIGCGRLAPDGTDMVKAIGRFARHKDGARLARFVLDCGAAIVDADGRHHEEEVRWAVEMSAALKRVCDMATGRMLWQ